MGCGQQELLSVHAAPSRGMAVAQVSCDFCACPYVCGNS